MKYDSQLAQLKTLLPNAKNILIALPTGADIDKLSAGLALTLGLEQAQKQVSIVCPEETRVFQSNLFGIDKVKQSISAGSDGNLTIRLEGVEITPDGKVAALQNLDWYPEGTNTLNL